MQSRAAEAYRSTRQKTASPRELEAGLLLAAASHLQAVPTDLVDDRHPPNTKALVAAITFNCKIWTILITSAMRGGSDLPDAIRQSVAELGLYVIRRSAQTLQEASGQSARDALATLVEINRSVASGLRG